MITLLIIWIIVALGLFALEYFFSGIWDNTKIDWIKTLL